jgi:hypothetical protein
MHKTRLIGNWFSNRPRWNALQPDFGLLDRPCPAALNSSRIVLRRERALM